MTTDNTQELDELVHIVWNSDTPYDAKMFIIDWHNKQVDKYKDIIKMADKYTFDTGEVYYSQQAVDKQIESVLDRLQSWQYQSRTNNLMDFIQDERKRLGGQSYDR